MELSRRTITFSSKKRCGKQNAGQNGYPFKNQHCFCLILKPTKGTVNILNKQKPKPQLLKPETVIKKIQKEFIKQIHFLV